MVTKLPLLVVDVRETGRAARANREQRLMMRPRRPRTTGQRTQLGASLEAEAMENRSTKKRKQGRSWSERRQLCRTSTNLSSLEGSSIHASKSTSSLNGASAAITSS